jgi:hypothetical protein
MKSAGSVVGGEAIGNVCSVFSGNISREDAASKAQAHRNNNNNKKKSDARPVYQKYRQRAG